MIKALRFVIPFCAAGLIVIVLALDSCARKGEPLGKNLICFRPAGPLSSRPFSPLVIIETNIQTAEAVQLAGLEDYLWPATYLYLDASDLQDTIAQVRPVVQRCAGVTNSAEGDMAVIIIDSRSTVINTIRQEDFCRLLQRIPLRVLQNNKVLNQKVHELKVFEGCALVDGSIDGNAAVSHQVTINRPSDLLSRGEHGSTGFTLDFVVHHFNDLRAMYCDPKTLQNRISSGVCVIDFVSIPFDEEVKVSTNATLHEVLENSDAEWLKGWNGNAPPNMRIISKRAIIADDGSSQFLQTTICPGDFIVVLPIEY